MTPVLHSTGKLLVLQSEILIIVHPISAKADHALKPRGLVFLLGQTLSRSSTVTV